MSDQQTYNMGDAIGQTVNIGGTINYFGNYPVEPAPQKDPRKVFLSYARADDEPFVRRLYDHLTANGFDAWFDREKMPNRGESFLAEIREAITAADTLLLIVGPRAVASDYVRVEWEYARETCTRVIPLLRQGEYASVPAPLRKLHAPDCRAARTEADALAEVARLLDDAPGALGTLYGVPPTPSYYVERDATAAVRGRLLADVDKPVVVTSAKDATTAVDGLGGVGKTTLATALSRTCEVRRAFPDGVFWLEVGQTPDVLALMSSVGAAFGDDRTEYRDRATAAGRLSALLSDKRALLVLDDVWNHDHAKDFRVMGTRCRLLVTTRSGNMAVKLDAGGERLMSMTTAEGLTLIAGRVGVPVDDLPPECKTIVELVGGHTLAVSLAAAQLADPDRGGLDYAPRLLKRLEKGKYFDKTLKLDETDKNLNLELCLRLSYDDLTPDLQRRFRALGVFAVEGTFDEAAALAVWGDDDADDTDDALTDLARAGLLRVEAGRYQQHGLLRAYARALLDEAGELEDAFNRYADHVTEQATQFDELPMQEWERLKPLLVHVQTIGDELSQRFAQEEAPNDELTQRVSTFASQVARYCTYRPDIMFTAKPEGLQPTRLAWYQNGIRACNLQGNLRRQSYLLFYLAEMFDRLGRTQQAVETLERVLALAEQLNDPRSIAVTQSKIADLYVKQGRWDDALALYEASLATKKQLNDPRSIAVTQINLAQHFIARAENLPRALKLLWEGYLTVERLKNPREIQTVQNIIRNFRQEQGEDAFSMLWNSIVNSPQPDWLQATHASQNPAMDAIRAFLNTSNWAEARAVYEANAAVLSSPEVEAIFEQNIAGADDERFKRNLQAHLDRIRRAKTEGVAAAFAEDAPSQ